MLDSISLENKVGTYYAYTFANGVEEALLKGTRTLVEDETEYSVNVNHKFNINQGAFSAYINGLLCPYAEEEKSNVGKFIVPELIADEGINPYEDSQLVYYVERPEKEELVSCVTEILTAANRNIEYSNAYTTNISLIPGVVGVYVNGVKLEKSAFSIIDEHTIILHNNIVGSQINYDANNSDT